MSSNARFCIMLGSVLAFVLLLALVLDGLYTIRVCSYVEAGYTQESLPGYSYPTWVKKGPAE